MSSKVSRFLLGLASAVSRQLPRRPCGASAGGLMRGLSWGYREGLVALLGGGLRHVGERVLDYLFELVADVAEG